MKNIYFILISLTFSTLYAQTPKPAPAQSGAILIMNGTAHLGNGQVIENSVIALDSGKITFVADARTVRIDRSKFTKIFDASGKHVYPGFIAPNTRLGLVDIAAVRASDDGSDVGTYNPQNRTIIAYNPDSEILPTVRSNGVLMAQVSPLGGRISGTSSVVQLDAWDYEDAIIKADNGLHLNWPNRQNNRRFGVEKPAEDPYEKNMEELNSLFEEAKAYSKEQKPAETNLKFEAMRGLFDSTKTLFLHADLAKNIELGVLFAEKHACKVVIVGGKESWLIIDFLKKHQVSVILSESTRLPTRDDEDIDQPYKTAATLQEAGILFCFMQNKSPEWATDVRNLSFQAGIAVGFGLPYEAAVGSLTLNTAKILGISNKCGSLEYGKDATLFISEGDALDMRTCKVIAAFIEGREIDLNNKHKALEAKFRRE